MTDVSLLASCAADLRIWAPSDATSGSIQPKASFTHQKGALTSVKWSRNGKMVASTSTDGSIAISHPSGALLTLFSGETGMESTCLDFSTTSRFLVSGGTDKVVNVWDLKQKECILHLRGHNSAVTALSFSSNDSHIASGCSDGTILVHSTLQRTIVGTLRTPEVTQSIKSLEYSLLSKRLLASASDEGTVIVWDCNISKPVARFLQQHKAPASTAVFSPVNHMLLASCGLDKRLVFYDVFEKSVVKAIECDAPITCMSFHSDGTTIAAGTSHGRIVLYDLRGGSAPISSIDAHSSAVQSLHYQPAAVRTKRPPMSPRIAASPSVHHRAHTAISTPVRHGAAPAALDLVSPVRVKAGHNVTVQSDDSGFLTPDRPVSGHVLPGVTPTPNAHLSRYSVTPMGSGPLYDHTPTHYATPISSTPISAPTPTPISAPTPTPISSTAPTDSNVTVVSEGKSVKGIIRGTPSLPPVDTGEYSLALLRSTLDDAIGGLRDDIKSDIHNVHIEVLRQMHKQDMEMKRLYAMIQQLSTNK